MSDEGTQGFCAGFGIGVLVGMVVFLPVGGCIQSGGWQRSAIEHNAAHYDSKTGEFTWNQEKATP